MNFSRCTRLGACLLLASACPADEQSDSGASTAGSGSETSATETGPSTSMTTSDVTTVSTTTSASDSSGAVTGDSSASAESGTTGASGCAEHTDQMACMAAGCKPVVGSPHVSEGDTICLGVREFIECQQPSNCDQAITTACENKDTTVYQFVDSCIPTGWIPCDAPPGGPFNSC